MRDARPMGVFGLTLVLALLALTLVAGGCSGNDAEGDSGADSSPKPTPAEAEAEPEPEPTYTSWQVYINDDDSFEQGGMTYSIALNLTATNPTGEIAGEYTGTATAKTDTNGDVGGQHLSASAVAQSTQLQFTLEDPTAGGALAPLTDEEAAYTGKGTIAMSAAGSGSIGGAGGPFSNASSQQITVRVEGDAVTLSVPISGHTYTFTGTISGK